ncbi:DVUA0089 family protein [Methylomonas sp. AM2-LC]|uniref:DVUA0089 family protein n=1 Tax=Methylomonas sp. AM2-LC TaxID=3153301 RepID=UPI00326502DB
MKKKLGFLLLSCSWALANSAVASDFDFKGNFQHDNDVMSFNLTINSPDNLTVFTSSSLQGGFDTVLTLWDSNGNQVFEDADGSSSGLGGSLSSNGTVYNYSENDSFFSLFLNPGHYLATLTQYDNLSASDKLTDGFFRNDPNFTAAFGCSNGVFCDGIQRFDNHGNLLASQNLTSEWSLHFLNAENAAVSSVPEAPGELLMATGLCLLFAVRKYQATKPTALFA